MALADEKGRERFVCAFCAQRLVAGKRVRTVGGKNSGKRVSVPASEVLRRQGAHQGGGHPAVAAHAVRHDRMARVVPAPSAGRDDPLWAQGQFTNITEKFQRVMGRVKMLIVLAFTVAGYNFDRARLQFAAENQFADPAEPALEDEYAPRDKSLPGAPKVTYRDEPEPQPAGSAPPG